MGRRPRSYLDILKPNISDRVSINQERQKEGHDRGTVHRSYAVGDAVWVRSFSQGPTWIAGEVVKYKGQCSLIVKLTDGHVVHRHLDHNKQKVGSTNPDQTTTIVDDPLIATGSPSTGNQPESASARSSEQEYSEPRRSARHRKPPDRLTI